MVTRGRTRSVGINSCGQAARQCHIPTSLLKDTVWGTKDLDQLLRRLPGARGDRGRLDGRMMRLLVVPRQALGLERWTELLPTPLDDDAEPPAILPMTTAPRIDQMIAELAAP